MNPNVETVICGGGVFFFHKMLQKGHIAPQKFIVSI